MNLGSPEPRVIEQAWHENAALSSARNLRGDIANSDLGRMDCRRISALETI